MVKRFLKIWVDEDTKKLVDLLAKKKGKKKHKVIRDAILEVLMDEI